ncbi:MAG: retropepsin-like domain-containing protein [Chloroflexi bacterium]|nr:retropepsin-like domain-containing protein [Chloroflexota bacterium]
MALVEFKHQTKDIWIPISMIVDTGADYSILPRSFATLLGIDLAVDCIEHRTLGIGGSEKIFLCRCQIVRLGKYRRTVPLGFLDRETGPTLLGRHECLETFRVIFGEHKTRFVNPRVRKRVAH